MDSRNLAGIGHDGHFAAASRDTSEMMRCHESGSCDGISEGRHAVCAAGICGYARPGTILTNPG